MENVKNYELELNEFKKLTGYKPIEYVDAVFDEKNLIISDKYILANGKEDGPSSHTVYAYKLDGEYVNFRSIDEIKECIEVRNFKKKRQAENSTCRIVSDDSLSDFVNYLSKQNKIDTNTNKKYVKVENDTRKTKVKINDITYNSIKEAAIALQKSPRTIIRMCNNGKAIVI